MLNIQLKHLKATYYTKVKVQSNFQDDLSPLSFRKEKNIKINPTNSTQKHQNIWENLNLFKLHNLLPVFVKKKKKKAFIVFGNFQKKEQAGSKYHQHKTHEKSKHPLTTSLPRGILETEISKCSVETLRHDTQKSLFAFCLFQQRMQYE